MNGIIQQQGTPREIYEHPRNLFVAGFIGHPPMNLVEARLEEKKLCFFDVALPRPEKLAGMSAFKGDRRHSADLDPAGWRLGSGHLPKHAVLWHQLQASIEWQGATLQVLESPLTHCLPHMFRSVLIRRSVRILIRRAGRLIAMPDGFCRKNETLWYNCSV